MLPRTQTSSSTATVSSTFSTSTTTSSSSSFSYASSVNEPYQSSRKPCSKEFLIPDTIDLVAVSTENIARLESNRRNSAWDEYLYETAIDKWGSEEDRLELRKHILKDMKEYYGNRKWKDVDCLEEVELYSNEPALKEYLDQLVLYGDFDRKRCKYVDRRHKEAPKSSFKRRRVSTGAEERASGLRSLLNKMAIS